MNFEELRKLDFFKQQLLLLLERIAKALEHGLKGIEED